MLKCSEMEEPHPFNNLKDSGSLLFFQPCSPAGNYMCRDSLCICRQRITFPLSAHPRFLYKLCILSAATLTYRLVLLFFMKTRVNLHTHRLNYTRRRHMYDVYDMGDAHFATITTTKSRSKPSPTSIPFIQLPPPIQSQPRFPPMHGKDASSTFTHAAYQNTQRAYQPCLKEAQGLYQALNMYHYTHPDEKLTPHCIRKHDCLLLSQLYRLTKFLMKDVWQAMLYKHGKWILQRHPSLKLQD